MYFTACSSDEFKCGNGLCVAKNKVCDGVIDCMDNSDEMNEECGEYLSVYSSFYSFVFFILSYVIFWLFSIQYIAY